MTIGLIVCGALGREVKAIIERNSLDVKLIGVAAIDHVYPERIAPDVEKRIIALREKYENLVVVYGDCGSKGELDQMLKNYPEIKRLRGPHCYEMYAGQQISEMMEEDPGTFFLTDFMVRTFFGLIVKSMGLDRFPALKQEYFRNYQRMIYLVQSEDPGTIQKAEQIAEYLELPLELRFTGLDGLESRILEQINI